jgi:hypothetical protein
MVVGANDRINRACLAGRYKEQIVERNFSPDTFSLHRLTHLAD